MSYAGFFPTFRIDLNMLRGDRIRTRKEFAEDHFIPRLQPGDTVRCVEEEGDQYLAIVEQVEGQRISLRLLLDSRIPAITVSSD